MKKKFRVFLSFEFGRDNELHYNFYAQAALYSQYEIIDYSLNEPYHPDARLLEKARKQIALSDIVIVIVGQDTHNAPGVEKVSVEEADVSGASAGTNIWRGPRCR